MITSTTPIRAEYTIVFPSENQKGIENHKKAARYFAEAARCHLEAAKYHGAGEHQKAAQSTVIALGYCRLASKAQNEDVKHHAMNDSL